MAVRHFCGFGAGSNAVAQAVAGTVSISSTIFKCAPYAARVNPTGANTGFYTMGPPGVTGGLGAFGIAPGTDSYVGFYFYAASLPSAAEGFVSIRQTGSNKLRVVLNPDGSISLLDTTSTVVATTAAGVISAATWTKVEIKTRGGATAPAEVRINESAVITLASVNQATANFDYVRLGKTENINGAAVDFYYDCLYVDDAGYINGDLSAIVLKPDADTTPAQWTAGTGSPPYTQINVVPETGTTYIKSTATAGDTHTCSFQSLADVGFASPAAIHGVLGFWRSREDAVGTSLTTHTLKSGGSVSATTARDTGTTLVTSERVAATDPATSATWTESGVNGIELRIAEANAVAIRCTLMLVEVLLTPASAGTNNLTSQDITTGAPVIGSPTIGQTQALTAQDITAGAPVIDSPTLGQIQALTSQNITAGAPVIDAPTLGSGSAPIVSDTFTGEADNTALAAHTGEIGATWTLRSGTGFQLSAIGRAFPVGSGFTTASGAPSTPDYEVSADVFLPASGTKQPVGLMGRWNASATSDGYLLRLDSTNKIQLYRYLAGAAVQIGADVTIVPPTAGGTPKNIKLRMIGSTIETWYDGVRTHQITDTNITRVGLAGLRSGGAGSLTTGYHLDNIAVQNLGANECTITGQTSNRIYQRTGTSATLALSGTYTGTLPDEVQIQVVRVSDGGIVQDWTAMSSPTIGGGSWSGNFAVPAAGDMLRINARTRAAGTVLATASGVSQIGVGDLFAVFGSSTSVKWFIDGTATETTVIRKYKDGVWQTLAANTGTGAIACAAALTGTTGYVVGYVEAGISGSYLSGQWDDVAFAGWTGLVSDLTAVGTIAGAIIHVGSNDAAADLIPDTATHLDRWHTLLGRLRTQAGNPNLPVYLLGCCRRTSGTDVQFDRARNTERILGTEANTYLASYSVDLETLDGIHPSPAAFTIIGQRVAQAVAYRLSLASWYGGPRPVSAGYVDASRLTVDVTVTPSGGTNLTPASAITGFTVSGSTVTTAARQSATVVRLTLAAAGAPGATVSYQAGRNPNITGAVFDNSSLTMPLEGVVDTGALAVAEPPTVALTAQDITTGAPVIGAPTLTEVAGATNLTSQNITTGAPTIAAATIGQVQVLVSQGITTGAPVIGSPTLGTASTSGIAGGRRSIDLLPHRRTAELTPHRRTVELAR
jgi:hypothetical protein